MNCAFPGLLCFAALLVGCANPKPLRVVAPELRSQVWFPNSQQEHVHASYSSVTGRSGRNLASGGLVAAVIGGTISIVSDAQGNDLMPQLRHATGKFEPDLVHDQFCERLRTAGIQISESNNAPALKLKLTSFGLREVQRGFFVPYVSAEAGLMDSGGKRLWHASAQSIGIKPRRKEEFQQSPILYRDDFLDVAADLSRQLIQGPIRTIN